MKNNHLIVSLIIITILVALTYLGVQQGKVAVSDKKISTETTLKTKITGLNSINKTELVGESENESLTENKKKTPSTKKFNCRDIYKEREKEENKNLEEEFLKHDSLEVRMVTAVTGFRGKFRMDDSEKVDFKKRSEVQISELVQLLNVYPDNKLINYHFVNACASNINNVNCSQGNLDKAAMLDNSNGVMWATIANIHLLKNNTEPAIEALKKAAAAPIFDDYRAERLTLLTDTLTHIGISKPFILIFALGFEAAIPVSGIGEVLQFCKQTEDAIRADISQLCLDYGKRLELDGGSLLFYTFGLSIQKMVHEQTDNERLMSQVTEKLEQYRKFITTYIEEDSLFYDESFQDYMLLTTRNHSEIESLQLLKEEADRLLSDPNYSPCPSS